MNKQQIALLRSFGISPEHLIDTYGETTIQRGLTYQRRKQATVLSASHEDEDTLLFTGKVTGSYSPMYMTKVTLEKYDSNKGVGCFVDSFCTCPVSTDCKHGIALLFEALHQLQDEQVANNVSSADLKACQEEKQLEEWLQAIEHDEFTPPSGIENAKPAQKQRVVYILDTTANNPDQLRIRPYKSTALKKGGYGQIYALHPNEILEANPFYKSKIFHTTDDEDILRVLLALPEYSTWSYRDDGWRFIGELAEILLPKLLKTERCFWGTQKSQPLQLGEERLLDIQWRKKAGYMVAEPQTQPAVDHVITIEHLYYVDAQRHALGLLTHKNLSHSQVLHFLNAPPIPKKFAKHVSEKLMRLLPDTDAPLPEKLTIKTVDIIDAVPVPRLRLHAEPLPSSPNKLHLASLVFVYDGIPSQPKTDADLAKSTRVILQEKVRYRITANHAHEQQAIQHLHRLGLQELEPTETFGVLDMVMPGYSLRDSVLRWDDFISDQLPKLEQAGWEIHIDSSFQLQVDTIDEWQAEIEEDAGNGWFELSLGFELDGKKINLLPLLVNLLAENPDTQQLRHQLSEKDHELFQLDAHQWIKLPTKRILTILDTLVELYDTDALTGDGNFAFSKHEGLHYGALLNDPQLRWKGAEELKALHDKLQSFSGIEHKAIPAGLHATLREYQQTGYNWLQFLRHYQFNGILADDMGLGKTLQTLTTLLEEKESGRATLPSLVIAPTSLMSNWYREAQRFTPDLNVLILQGAKRKAYFEHLHDYDVVLTTYPLILRDADVYDEQEFHYLILDEAQAIKNAKSKSTQQIYSLQANHRLCLTGTPIENHLGELWSMFHFLMPGYLSTQERFNRLFRKPIEKDGDDVRGEQLRKRVQPFMLRRTKDLVTKELPEKTEIIRTVPLTGKQRDLYETVRLAMDKKVRDEISKKGLARSHIIVLEALLKLRQVCCDPKLVKLTKAKSVKESAKLDLLMSLVPEMVEAGRKILIFSQFTTMLGIIEKALQKEKISYSKLTGQTRKREDAIAAFQDGDAEVFLISLKAGGVGLNLTAADTVIHYDPWWNPAVEQQATDRAYRIGQDKPVFVYKLLTEETVEEKILAMQAKKQALADSVYRGGKQQEAAFGQDDLVELLKPLS